MGRTGSQFGLTDDQWVQAVDEVREAILDAAYDRRMTWYGEISDNVSVIHLDPHSLLMNALLGAVFEREHEAGRAALTSIVTHKYGDKEPGPGFYDKARALGYRFNEPYVFWAQQVQAVFKEHGKPDRHLEGSAGVSATNQSAANEDARSAACERVVERDKTLSASARLPALISPIR